MLTLTILLVSNLSIAVQSILPWAWLKRKGGELPKEPLLGRFVITVSYIKLYSLGIMDFELIIVQFGKRVYQ